MIAFRFAATAAVIALAASATPAAAKTFEMQEVFISSYSLGGTATDLPAPPKLASPAQPRAEGRDFLVWQKNLGTQGTAAPSGPRQGPTLRAPGTRALPSR